MKIQFALIATLFAASTASAADVYVGGSIGQARANLGQTGNVDHIDRAGKVLIGTQLNKNFGIEASYADFGDFTSTHGVVRRDTAVKAGALDLVATLPLTERFSVIGRTGVARTRVAEDFTAANLVRHDKEFTNGLHAGVGVQYKLTQNLAARAEFEAYRAKNTFGDRGHMKLATVGLTYTFGAKPAAVKTVSYTAPAPAPTPVYTPAPVAAPTPAPAAEPVVTTTKKIRE